MTLRIDSVLLDRSGLNMLARQWDEFLPQDTSVLAIHPGSVATVSGPVPSSKLRNLTKFGLIIGN